MHAWRVFGTPTPYTLHPTPYDSVEGARTVAPAHAAAADAAVAVLAAEQRSAGGFTDQASPVTIGSQAVTIGSHR